MRQESRAIGSDGEEPRKGLKEAGSPIRDEAQTSNDQHDGAEQEHAARTAGAPRAIGWLLEKLILVVIRAAAAVGLIADNVILDVSRLGIVGVTAACRSLLSLTMSIHLATFCCPLLAAN